MDINALKKRLGEISSKNGKTSHIWKPTAGKQNIRIVPYKFQPENPFIELKFHYEFGGKTYLSPATFGRPDPMVELANKLRKTGTKEDYTLSTKFFPKLRIYAPIIVRGEEDQGVKFWGFGKQVYQDILRICADTDYGDIASLTEGNDLTIEFLSKEETGKNFPETHVTPRPKKTPVGDAKVIEAIKKQVSITDIYEEPEYDTLKGILDAFLNPEDSAEETTEASAEDSDEAESVVVAKTAPKAKEAPAKASSKNVVQDFDALFNS